MFDSRCIPIDPSESRSNEREKYERHLSTSDATYFSNKKEMSDKSLGSVHVIEKQWHGHACTIEKQRRVCLLPYSRYLHCQQTMVQISDMEPEWNLRTFCHLQIIGFGQIVFATSYY